MISYDFCGERATGFSPNVSLVPPDNCHAAFVRTHCYHAIVLTRQHVATSSVLVLEVWDFICTGAWLVTYYKCPYVTSIIIDGAPITGHEGPEGE